MDFCVSSIQHELFGNLSRMFCFQYILKCIENVQKAFNFRQIKNLLMVSARFCEICYSGSTSIPLNVVNIFQQHVLRSKNSCIMYL